MAARHTWRADWRPHRARPPAASTRREAPLRMPADIARRPLPRLAALHDAAAWLRDGRPFVCGAASALCAGAGSMLRWDLGFLAAHLPTDTLFGVHLVDEKLLMSHSLRYDAAGGAAEASAADGGFPRSGRRRLTFHEFVAAAERRVRSGAGPRPYLGFNLFQRAHKGDLRGTACLQDATLRGDLDVLMRGALEPMHARGELPLLSSIHAFVGISETLYHCHYDLNPNLHFQLVGRKRFILFAPSDWRHMYPFPAHHDWDRRSRVDWDHPDDRRFPNWSQASGMTVELQPGDCLYIPPYWWHHVQTLTTPCVSIACWFYDVHPGDRDLMPSSGAASHLQSLQPTSTARARPTVSNAYGGHFFGLSAGGAELCLTRWFEQLVGMQIELADLKGESNVAASKAQQDGLAYAGVAKLEAVAMWMRCIGKFAAGQPLSPAEMRSLPRLKVPLEVLMPQIYELLMADLEFSSISQVKAWVQSVVATLGFGDPAAFRH
ncbi:hypothetical protein AB1Y20_018021 [Prymnesium parvum]|uniref:JmjC domain-containing protein n=1 Tax=Prymnesium parvum TaxID=97485 RepID=A0AB34JNI4_PRYPA